MMWDIWRISLRFPQDTGTAWLLMSTELYGRGAKRRTVGSDLPIWHTPPHIFAASLIEYQLFITRPKKRMPLRYSRQWATLTREIFLKQRLVYITRMLFWRAKASLCRAKTHRMRKLYPTRLLMRDIMPEPGSIPIILRLISTI